MSCLASWLLPCAVGDVLMTVLSSQRRLRCAQCEMCGMSARCRRTRTEMPGFADCLCCLLSGSRGLPLGGACGSRRVTEACGWPVVHVTTCREERLQEVDLEG